MQKPKKLTIGGRVPKDPNVPYPDEHYVVQFVNNNWLDVRSLTPKQFEHFKLGLQIEIIESLLENNDEKVINLNRKLLAIDRIYVKGKMALS